MNIIKGDYRKENLRTAHELTAEFKQSIYTKIMAALKDHSGMTFRGIAIKTGLHEQQVWKRLNELEKQDKIEVIGKTICPFSNRSVSVWKEK